MLVATSYKAYAAAELGGDCHDILFILLSRHPHAVSAMYASSSVIKWWMGYGVPEESFLPTHELGY